MQSGKRHAPPTMPPDESSGFYNTAARPCAAVCSRETSRVPLSAAPWCRGSPVLTDVSILSAHAKRHVSSHRRRHLASGHYVFPQVRPLAETGLFLPSSTAWHPNTVSPLVTWFLTPKCNSDLETSAYPWPFRSNMVWWKAYWKSVSFTDLLGDLGQIA